jgi:hypothetical protein
MDREGAHPPGAMSELDDIKAVERWPSKAEYEAGFEEWYGLGSRTREALDRAIAIAEGTQEAFNLLMDEKVKVSDGILTAELEQARADVLKLRQAILTGDVDLNLAAITDTEHYENHR